MANALYPKAKESFINGHINMSANTITIALVDTGVYTYSASHQYRSEVSNSAVISTTTLTNKTVTNGVFDADDVESGRDEPHCAAADRALPADSGAAFAGHLLRDGEPAGGREGSGTVMRLAARGGFEE